MERTLRIRRTYPHPRERVWRALTHSDALAAWLMPNNFEPQVGHEFTLTTEPGPGFDGIVRCQVLELDAPRRMVWSWRGGPIDTIVAFDLEKKAEGTELSVEQSGFRGLQPILVSFILGAGARSMYGKKLPAVLDNLASDQDPAARTSNETCEDGGFWKVLRGLFAPLLRRKR